MQHKESALWVMFSKFIRLRDSDERGYCRCISCGLVRDWQMMDAGHYVAIGSNGGLKFNEKNVNAQCTSCNRHKSGNLIDYRIGLVNKIGEKAVKNLEAIYQMKTISKKLSQIEIDFLYKEYSQKVKDILKTKMF